jgi:superfamily II DNA or RNA helicase
MQLRDYQEEIIDKVRKEFARGKKRVCLQLPTGAGKTI